MQFFRFLLLLKAYTAVDNIFNEIILGILDLKDISFIKVNHQKNLTMIQIKQQTIKVL